MRVALSVITYQRPVGLARTLASIGAMHTSGIPDVDVRVIVIDNDPAQSARAVVDQVREGFPFPIEYAQELTQGEPWARNRALEVMGPVDAVGWIDDDECPFPAWLEAMVTTMRATDADVLQGPVVPIFEIEPPRWVRDGRYYERTPAEGFVTGQPFGRNWARGSGCFVRASLYDNGSRYNLKWGRKGGVDRGFFERIAARGARFVWCEEAAVYDYVPATRVSWRWLAIRRYREGTTRSLLLTYEFAAPWRRRLERGFDGVLKIGRGIGEYVVAIPKGRIARLDAVRRITFGAGIVVGAFGGSYEEYRTIHGH